jgi:hypothetical protein
MREQHAIPVYWITVYSRRVMAKPMTFILQRMTLWRYDAICDAMTQWRDDAMTLWHISIQYVLEYYTVQVPSTPIRGIPSTYIVCSYHRGQRMTQLHDVACACHVPCVATLRPMLTDIRECKTNRNFGSVCRIPDAYGVFCTTKTSVWFVISTNRAIFYKPEPSGLQLEMLQTMNYKPCKSREIGAAPRI